MAYLLFDGQMRPFILSDESQQQKVTNNLIRNRNHR
jgi:hypothetical protein